MKEKLKDIEATNRINYGNGRGKQLFKSKILGKMATSLVESFDITGRFSVKVQPKRRIIRSALFDKSLSDKENKVEVIKEDIIKIMNGME